MFRDDALMLGKIEQVTIAGDDGIQSPPCAGFVVLAAVLSEHRVEHFHDDALAGFWQCADALQLLLNLRHRLSLALGAGRVLYAGMAKALPFLVSRGESEMAHALAVSAARNTLKKWFRLNSRTTFRIYPPEKIIAKYGTPEAIINAATHTSPSLMRLAQTRQLVAQ